MIQRATIEDPKWWSDSVWCSGAEPELATPSLDSSLAVDTVVIGAGYTGLRAAHVLATAGQRVAVLDAHTIGWGASGRNAGQVNPIPPHLHPEKVRAVLGADYFGRFVSAALGSADELFNLISTENISCEARRNGCLRSDHSATARDKARAIAAAWNAHGAKLNFIDGERLHEIVGSTAYDSAVLVRNGGAIQPFSFAQGLARSALSAGAQIFCRSRVTNLTRLRRAWRVATPCGHVEAQSVLICTNGYTDALVPGLAQSIIPLTSIQMATDPLPRSRIDGVLAGGETMIDTRRAAFYCRREPDGRMIVGTVGRLSRRGDAAAFVWLQKETERIFPSLRGVAWKCRWGGRIAINRDHLPQLHELAPNLFAGLGYNGRGVAMACVMGRVLAERVMGRAPTSLPFPVTSVKPYSFHSMYEVGARIRLWAMRQQDRKEMTKRPA